MKAHEKYLEVRSQINNGDIILCRGTRLLASLIHWGDAVKDKDGKWVNAYYNHSALVFKKGDRLLTIDSVANGVQPHFLSQLMKEYADFCVIRPTSFSGGQIDDAVNKAIMKAEDTIKYDYWMLPRIGLYRRFGWNTKNLGSSDKDTCSEFTGIRYAIGCLGIESLKAVFDKQGFISPQDHKRHLGSQLSIMFDDSKY